MSTWKIDIVDDRIHLETPFSERVKDAVKSIEGARWNGHRKTWTYPLHWEVCTQVRKKAKQFKAKLEIGDALWEWAEKEKLRQQSIPDVNSMETVELDLLTRSPRIAEAARGYQTVGIAFGARNREVLIADEPGLGKTLQVIGAVHENGIGGPILVIAPKSAAVATWPEQLRRWAPDDKYIVIGAHQKPAQRVSALQEVMRYCDEHPDEHYWVSMNVDYLRAKGQVDSYQNYVRDPKGNKIIEYGPYTIPEAFGIKWSAIIIDECHNTLAGSTGNKKKWSQQRFGLDMIEVREGGLRLAMSGTPFRGKRENAWGILNWLRPDLYTSYWKWVRKHFVTYIDDFSGAEITTNDVKNEDAFYADISRVMLRRTKLEVAGFLPPKTYAGAPLYDDDPDSPVAVWLPMLPAQEKAYRRLVKAAEVDIDGGTLTPNGILAEITRQRQLANAEHRFVGDKLVPFADTKKSNKIAWLESWLEEREYFKLGSEEKGKVIIASQFAGFIDEIGAWLLDYGNVPHFKLTGATSAKERERIQQEFQKEGGPRIVLISTKAGGTSLTLDAADDVIILDGTGVPDDQEQLEDRAHRVSRPDHKVTIWYVCSLGTIEEAIAATSNNRNADVKSILDGARGVNQIKNILNYSVKD